MSLFLRADDELTGTDEFNREAGQFLLKEKVDILDEIDDGKNQIDVSRECGIPLSTITTILKD